MIKQENTQKIISNLDDSNQQSFEIGDLKYIFETLQKNIYNNKPQAVIREIMSNCLDANMESGSKRHIEITTPSKENNNCFHFRDFGIGMDSERINIYRKICDSTKRNTNTQIGYFGIGSKSPFAITDTFYVNTIVNSVMNKYIVFKGNDGVPKINLIHQEETTEETGTEIIIPFTTVEYISEAMKYLALMVIANPFGYKVDGNVFNLDSKCFNRYYNDYLKHNYVVYNIETIINRLKSMLFNNVSISTYTLRDILNSNNILTNGKIPYLVKSIYGGSDGLYVVKFEIGKLTVAANRETLAECNSNKRLIKSVNENIQNNIDNLTISVKTLAKKSLLHFQLASIYKNRNNSNILHEINSDLINFVNHEMCHAYENIRGDIKKCVSKHFHINNIIRAHVVIIGNHGKSSQMKYHVNRIFQLNPSLKYVVLIQDREYTRNHKYRDYIGIPYLHNYAPLLPEKKSVVKREKSNDDLKKVYLNTILDRYYSTDIRFCAHRFCSNSTTLYDAQKNPDKFRYIPSNRGTCEYGSDDERQKIIELKSLLRDDAISLKNKDGKELRIIKHAKTKLREIKNVKQFDINEDIVNLTSIFVEKFILETLQWIIYYKFRHIVKTYNYSSYIILSTNYIDRKIRFININYKDFKKTFNKYADGNQKKYYDVCIKRNIEKFDKLLEEFTKTPELLLIHMSLSDLRESYKEKIFNKINTIGDKTKGVYL